MEKLELKHLAPYLPYGLKMSEQKYDLVLNVNNHPNHCVDLEYSIKEQVKPILRPLSDLTKEKHFEKLKEINKDFDFEQEPKVLDDLMIIPSCYENYVELEFTEWFYLMEYLYKNHFDVFGLINKGLAIDINTLKN